MFHFLKNYLFLGNAIIIGYTKMDIKLENYFHDSGKVLYIDKVHGIDIYRTIIGTRQNLHHPWRRPEKDEEYIEGYIGKSHVKLIPCGSFMNNDPISFQYSLKTRVDGLFRIFNSYNTHNTLREIQKHVGVFKRYRKLFSEKFGKIFYYEDKYGFDESIYENYYLFLEKIIKKDMDIVQGIKANKQFIYLAKTKKFNEVNKLLLNILKS